MGCGSVSGGKKRKAKSQAKPNHRESGSGPQQNSTLAGQSRQAWKRGGGIGSIYGFYKPRKTFDRARAKTVVVRELCSYLVLQVLSNLALHIVPHLNEAIHRTCHLTHNASQCCNHMNTSCIAIHQPTIPRSALPSSGCLKIG